jgi:hypothetical protein
VIFQASARFAEVAALAFALRFDVAASAPSSAPTGLSPLGPRRKASAAGGRGSDRDSHVFDFGDGDGEGGEGGGGGGRGPKRYTGKRYTGASGEALPKVRGGGVLYQPQAHQAGWHRPPAAAAAAPERRPQLETTGTAGRQAVDGEDAAEGSSGSSSGSSGAERAWRGRAAGDGDAAAAAASALLRRRWVRELGLSPAMVLDAKARSCDLMAASEVARERGTWLGRGRVDISTGARFAPLLRMTCVS